MKKHQIFYKQLFLIFLPSVSLFLLLFGYLFAAYFLPLPKVFLEPPSPATTKIFDRNGLLLYEILNPNEGRKTIIPLDKIPESVINATLVAEDRDFFSHGGLDFKAIARAIYLNFSEGRIVSGGSTITQQLVRNMLGTQQQRTYFNKLREAAYAIRLHHIYDKKTILEMYLNKIYYGNLAYGIESAALDYFGKHVYDLDSAEAALIAGLPQSPANYNPFFNFKKAKKRQEYILDLMAKDEFLKTDELALAKDEPLHFRKNKVSIKAPHFVYFVLNELEKVYGEDNVNYGGLNVYTTLDYNLQAKAENLLQIHVDRLKDSHVGSGALLSIDLNNNEILTWVGSKDYFDDQIDGAVDMLTSLRQPGSAIKPFNYLAAFLKGYTPATTVTDIYTQFDTETGPYTPKNYDLKFHGLVRLRTSLASSFNVPAVKVLDYVGLPNFINFLKTLGIDSLEENPSHYGLSLTLGGGEVRPLDLAEAYTVLAHYGTKKELQFIEKITNSVETFRWDVSRPVFTQNGQQILGPRGPQAAYQIIDILSDKNARIPAFGQGNILELSRPAAVKTGTTRNFKDNWTVGFTPDFLTLVWMGNADASSMENVSGVTGAAPLWNTFMEEALRHTPVHDFTRPPGLKDVEICELSGKLPTQNCQKRLMETFIEGTEPKEYDAMWKEFKITKWQYVRRDVALQRLYDGNADILVQDGCDVSPEFITTKIFIDFPPDLRRWALENNIPQPPEITCGKPVETRFIASPTNKNDNPKIIEIINPQSDDSYQFNPEIPAASQKIPLRVNVSRQVKSVHWFIDGQLVGEVSEFPFTFLWNMQPGWHQVSAVGILTDGQKIKVEGGKFEVK